MKNSLNIVCHAFPSWRGDYMKSTVQLMKELAVNHRVLYVDYAYSWKDILVNIKHNKYIPVKRILRIDNSIEKVNLSSGAELNVLSLPPIIPFNWISNKYLYKTVQFINQKIIEKSIQKALKKLDMQTHVMVNAFNPFFGLNGYKNIKPKATVYYCYDNIEASNWASKHGARLEKEFITKTDTVVFTSETLKKSKFNASKAHVVNNGVDVSLFQKEMECIQLPSTNGKINVGYVGTIDNRLDYTLLENCIKQFPNWDFHFIGRVMENANEPLLKYDNVRFYGAVDIKELPAMMKNFNVGIIPFLKNEFTVNIYPMKANEYLALGLPVVMTPFAEINDLHRIVTVADTNTFASSLEIEVMKNNEELQQLRKNFALSNNWKNKAIEFENILYQYAS